MNAKYIPVVSTTDKSHKDGSKVNLKLYSPGIHQFIS